jgi:hypothetical protein
MKIQKKISVYLQSHHHFVTKYKFCTEMGLRHWHLIRSEWFVASDKSVRYWHLCHTEHSSHVYTNGPRFQFESMLLTHHSTTSLTLICPLPRHANQRVSATQQNVQHLHTPCRLLPFVKLLDFGVEGDRVQHRLSDYKRCSRFCSVTDRQSKFKCSETSHDCTRKLHLALIASHFIMATDFVMWFLVSGVLLSSLFFS